ncbi:ribosome small subunit-dependent GTPase A [Neolewinella lacunae]|uniref:Small ribosomal subunit biogenesis GTPase RsgA n=1 Tax=Neolewinella lacunae TaxID=1517758 RepID=A0A923PMD8_9BACT|nr:ribosome small subunit-dependent GTPase A [Neolewinella lacunae]MBC6996119.1 ribosome small subunit-dependent GTPase A [Neolewinella lacunae]MDN3633972.1 ribosome small subunit-dependent GTPase A [Neolewinella lacunae]
MQKGTVTKSTGSWYDVLLDEPSPAGDVVLRCRVAGRFRLEDKQLTNPIAVGDRVAVSIENTGDAETGAIREIEERRNYVVRQSPRKKHELHLLASNIDQAVLIVTVVFPDLKLGFIDRFLLMTEPFGIPTTIVFNKADLYDENAMATFEVVADIYTAIGYEVLLVSAQEGTGIAAFRELLRGKRSLISGQSGVGKSTLVNAVAPELDLRTGELSDYTGKGQHTTTFAELFQLPFGGEIIDPPGIKNLSFNYLKPIEVAYYFREIFALSPECRFGGACLHKGEPGCAVIASVAAEDDRVTDLRYNSYLTLLAETEEQNYWERKKV